MTNHYYASLKVLVENLFIYGEPIYVIGCGSVVGSKCFCAHRVWEYSEEEEVCGSGIASPNLMVLQKEISVGLAELSAWKSALF